MVGVATGKLIARKSCVHFLAQTVQQLVDLQNGVVPFVSRMGCRHLLITDEQQGAVPVQCQAGVEHLSQFRPAQLGQGVSADSGPAQQAFVGGIPHREKSAAYLDGEAQVFCGIHDGVLTDRRVKAGGVTTEENSCPTAPHAGRGSLLVPRGWPCASPYGEASWPAGH